MTLPANWTDCGMDWNDPDPTDRNYWNAILLAIRERADVMSYARNTLQPFPFGWHLTEDYMRKIQSDILTMAYSFDQIKTAFSHTGKCGWEFPTSDIQIITQFPDLMKIPTNGTPANDLKNFMKACRLALNQMVQKHALVDFIKSMQGDDFITPGGYAASWYATNQDHTNWGTAASRSTWKSRENRNAKFFRMTENSDNHAIFMDWSDISRITYHHPENEPQSWDSFDGTYPPIQPAENPILTATTTPIEIGTIAPGGEFSIGPVQASIPATIPGDLGDGYLMYGYIAEFQFFTRFDFQGGFSFY